MKKQAVLIIHGMGEQIPMETLTSFVDSVWTSDDALVDRNKPDPDTGSPNRTRNASWSRPDRRNRSFELRLITTETGKNRRRTDFFEFYWAHLLNDTTWDQVRAWIFELMLRNPFKRVPRGVLPAWILLWLIALIVVAVGIFTLRPNSEVTWLGAIAATVATAAVGAFVSAFLVRYFGDVARYVKAKPPNVARRQEIRENGVQLLETLMGVEPDGTILPWRDREYDRIVVVAHSLGTIVAYDILTHAFARINTVHADPLEQPSRVKLEEMIRAAAGLPTQVGAPAPAPWSIDAFQALQAEARKELNKGGNPWIVSDFVTLGSPLTHAEFLMVRDREKLTDAKRQRVLPTCPPALEYDGSTKLHHFTYRGAGYGDVGDDNDPAAPRGPHHAALFAYTRWSNLYSSHARILWGDIISGPVAEAFGLEAPSVTVCGIRDIAVMPRLEGLSPAMGERRPFFTHTKYWSFTGQRPPPYHIAKLREVLRLGD
jgi:hypothetical protein